MSDCQSFVDFCNKFGDDLASSILETIHNLKKGQTIDGVHMYDIHQHNATNHVFSGTVDVDDEVYGFVVESGDNAGTVILDWGLEDDVKPYEPGEPTFYTFTVKGIDFKPEKEKEIILKKYNIIKETDTFKEKVRAYNYDRHFSPGVVVEEHYKKWANDHGFEITPVE